MFDIYFQPEYPSVPPLVLITTTGVLSHGSMDGRCTQGLTCLQSLKIPTLKVVIQSDP